MKITKYGHSALMLEESGKRFLIDPGQLSDLPEKYGVVDALLITHEHGDHYSLDEVKRILVESPGCTVITHHALAESLTKEGVVVSAMKEGESIDVGGVIVTAHGSDHAEIHRSISCISNSGYMIGDDFFYPGDSFTVPGKDVKILALPIAAPWMAVKEAIDYVNEVTPKHAIAVHDAVLSESGRAIHHRVISGALSSGEFHDLELHKEYVF